MAKESKDHEIAMAQSQLASTKTNVSKLQKKLGKRERDIPAWIQAKITDTAHNMDAAASYKEGVSFDIGPGHKGAQKTQKIYNKGKSTDNPNEKETFLKRTGPQLPLAKRQTKLQVAHNELSGNLISEREFDEPGEPRRTQYQKVDPKAWEKSRKQWEKLQPNIFKPKLPQAKAKSKVQVAHYEIEGDIIETKSGDSSLRDWFAKSRSSDGTPGWVQMGGKYAGKPCAKQPGQTTKPKCGSSKMKAALSDEEEQKAFERKNRKDPNENRRGQAKNVATESYSNWRQELFTEEGEKDACYKKVKSRYKIWPSAYASGALVKCRKVGASNWGNKTKKEEFDGITFQQFQEKCWDGYKQVGMKKKGKKMVPNCVPEEIQNEGAAWTRSAGQNKKGGLNEKGRRSYERENPGSDLKAPSKKVGNPRRASFCARMSGMKRKLTSKKTANDPDSRINKSLRAWNC